MRASLDEQALADLLPGAWIVAATNFPLWLSGQRRAPRLDYGLISREPLVLSDDVAFTMGPGKHEGKKKHILGRDAFKRDEFVWRGTGVLTLLTSRWRVTGVSDDGSIVVTHFTQSIGTPAGVNIIVREGAMQPEVRAVIAHATDDFGLTPEQFASLSWLDSGASS